MMVFTACGDVCSMLVHAVQVSAEPLCRPMSCYGASAFVSDTGYLQGLEVRLSTFPASPYFCG